MNAIQASRKAHDCWQRHRRLRPQPVGRPTRANPYGSGWSRTNARQRRRRDHWWREAMGANAWVTQAWVREWSKRYGRNAETWPGLRARLDARKDFSPAGQSKPLTGLSSSAKVGA